MKQKNTPSSQPGRYAAPLSKRYWIGIFAALAVLSTITGGCIAIGVHRNPAQTPPAVQAAPAEQTQPAPLPTEPEPLPWNLTLVNSECPLSEDFEAPELTQLMNGQAFDTRAYPQLQQMMDDARAAGLRPLICSSFRTWEDQTQLYDRKVASCVALGLELPQAQTEAALWVARPGTSEHQLGLAVDIVSKQYQVLDEAQADTPLQQWLMAHCWEHGFILRYPQDKTQLTGIGFEPWHYRYVGEDAAREIMLRGICLEEYLQSWESSADGSSSI